MADWKDNIIKYDWADPHVHPAVRYPSVWVSGAGTGIDAVIGVVKSFNPRVSTPKDVIHSLGDYNQGMVSKPPEYYVDITCSPFGTGYEVLMACQNGDRYFDVVLAPAEDFGGTTGNIAVGRQSSWAPEYEVFIGCKVVDHTERYAIGTEPTVTFSCRALRFAYGQGTDRKEFGNGNLGRAMSDSNLGIS